MCHHCCLKKTGPVFCLLTGMPLGSLPSCPGLVSAQLLEERPSNSPQCLPAQPASSCFHVFSLARCLNPFYTKAKNWRQEGEKGGRVWLRGSRSVHTLCCGPLSVLTHYSWSVSLGKKRPEGLKKPKNRSEEHSCACFICLPGSRRPEAGQKTQPSSQVEQAALCPFQPRRQLALGFHSAP